MQTSFSPAQLADPATASSEAVIRKCVHCGFCTATCPTYLLLGDELDSPRGRIYLMKDMLENERAPSAEVVKHIDRCLSCLSCMTTCPSGVNYMHLVDHARAYIEARYRRPWRERLLRGMLARVLPYPARFRLALRLARWGRPAAPLVGRVAVLRPLAAMLDLAPERVSPKPARAAAAAWTRGRVVLLQGCAEPVLRPEYRAAAVRLLHRTGFAVTFAAGEGCCGALVHHLGRDAESLAAARRNVDAWTREIDRGGLAAILVTASGCGTAIKGLRLPAARRPPLIRRRRRGSRRWPGDVSEFLVDAGLPAGDGRGLTVAYHAACSLQHGQNVTEAPKRLLVHAGFAVRTPVEAHICCGSAGTYNILQPEIAGRLGARKVGHIARLEPDVIATGNVGCAVQIGRRTEIPVVHTVELIDWATGGPAPAALAGRPTGRPA